VIVVGEPRVEFVECVRDLTEFRCLVRRDGLPGDRVHDLVDVLDERLLFSSSSEILGLPLVVLEEAVQQFAPQGVGENDAVVSPIEDVGRVENERRHVRRRRAGKFFVQRLPERVCARRCTRHDENVLRVVLVEEGPVLVACRPVDVLDAEGRRDQGALELPTSRVCSHIGYPWTSPEGGVENRCCRWSHRIRAERRRRQRGRRVSP